MRRNLLALLIVLVFSAAATQAEDWPQWEGPNRDSVWPEEGIVDRFPDQGLPIAWRAEVGLGYAGPAVADGRIYLMDYLRESGEMTNNPGKRDKLTGKERVLCLDAKTGTPIWKHEYARIQPFLSGRAALHTHRRRRQSLRLGRGGEPVVSRCQGRESDLER